MLVTYPLETTSTNVTCSCVFASKPYQNITKYVPFSISLAHTNRVSILAVNGALPLTIIIFDKLLFTLVKSL